MIFTSQLGSNAAVLGEFQLGEIGTLEALAPAPMTLSEAVAFGQVGSRVNAETLVLSEGLNTLQSGPPIVLNENLLQRVELVPTLPKKVQNYTSYGEGAEGQTPWGGYSIELGAPTLVSSTPTNGDVSQASSVPIVFEVTCPIDLNGYTLAVALNGVFGISGGDFLPGYSGEIFVEGTTCRVVIDTHPALPGGVSSTITVSIQNLAGQGSTLPFSFFVSPASVTNAETLNLSEAIQNVREVPFSETLTVTEGIVVDNGSEINLIENPNPIVDSAVISVGAVQTQAETLSLFESVRAASFLVTSTGSSTLEVQFPEDLRIENIGHLRNYSFLPISAGAIPLDLQEIKPIVAPVSAGVKGEVIPAFKAAGNAQIAGTTLTDFAVDFRGSGVGPGDIISFDPSPADIRVVAVLDAHRLQVDTNFGSPISAYYRVNHHPSVTTHYFRNKMGGIDAPVFNNLNTYNLFSLSSFGAVLTVGMNSNSTTITTSAASGAPAVPFLALIDEEVVLVTSLGVYSTTVVRAQQGTVAAAHDVGTLLVPLQGNQVNRSTFLQILEVVNPYVIRLDRPLCLAEPTNGNLPWTQQTGVQGLQLKVSEPTNGKIYEFTVRHLRKRITNQLFEGATRFTAVSAQPQLQAVSFQNDGSVTLEYNEDMRFDGALMDPGEYTITGPSSVRVTDVQALSNRKVVLRTIGMGVGSYTVTVNATGTPKDVAGNPISASFNTAIFTGSQPLLSRSVFTDKGPIAKPVETLQSGSGVTIHTYTSPIFGGSTFFTSNEVSLVGGAFTSDAVGMTVELSGTARNNGLFRVKAVISPTRLSLEASFSLPDANNGSGSWKLVNPHHGEVADDPSDVTVRINGTPVTPEAVIGLLGQVVLPTAPSPSDDVKINYSWIREPTVDFRRLNSKEFLLNNWVHDTGTRGYERHHYRYRSALVRPGNYVPDNMLAKQDAPLQRDVFYRAYERAYSALLNDPALLLLNVPTHKIAYPPLKRMIEESSVSYTANTLPENDPVTTWTRKGSGPATALSGVLTIEDNTTGPFPGGEPLFWSRPIDLTFDHVYAATWRMRVASVQAMEGVFTGVATGWSNDKKVIVLGYLESGGTKKIGILRKGGGLDPSLLSSWTGGIDNALQSTDAPSDFDWSILHSYRFFQGKDGVVRAFVDGETTERLRVVEDDLPFLEELNAPFNEVQGVFFGSISRPAKTISEWDFVRYVVLPSNPEQSAANIFVSYEGTVLPEAALPSIWTPVGYHGTERVLGDSLILESTSSTDPVIGDDVGLVGGDFKGFTRTEPLLSVASKVDVDFKVRLDAHTHGMRPNALMVAVDDGDRLVQVSFLASKSQPSISYPGRSLPEDATPNAWTKVGTAQEEIVGRVLRLTDSDSSNGIAYYRVDAEAVESETRTFSSLRDYTFEFRTKVLSYNPDSNGFAGITADVSDGLRSVCLHLRRDLGATLASGSGTASALTFTDVSKNFTALGVTGGDELIVSGNSYPIVSVSGTTLTLQAAVPFVGSVAYTVQDSLRKIAFHSDGVAIPSGEWPFEWYGTEHTFRVVKTATAGTLVTSGFTGTFADNGNGTANFSDGGNGGLLATVQAGDTVVVASGPSAGAYNVLSVGVSFVVLEGLVVSSSNIIYRVERSRNMVVSLFADDVFLGAIDYNDFLPSLTTEASASFGSASAPLVQTAAQSKVDWHFYNVWGMGSSSKYVGLWKGTDSNSLLGYHTPVRGEGSASIPSSTSLVDTSANFTGQGVQVGDICVIDLGPNQGEYQVTSVAAQTLIVTPAFPVFPTLDQYRIPQKVDWTADHTYRILRDPSGAVSLFIDNVSPAAIQVPYGQLALPPSSAGVPSEIQNGLPSITWGAFDPTSISRSVWDYLRYGIVSSLVEERRVPQHQVLNERNVMASPEHLFGSVAHDHTQFSASSTGVPYPWKAYVENPGVRAFTQLNEGTPIVPKTQTYEVRNPTPVFTPVAALNTPQNVLNSNGGFLLNDGETKVELLVPDDVLYRSLEVVERSTGEVSLLAPAVDMGIVDLGTLSYQKEVCLHYDGSVLPENDVASPTPWAFASEPGASYTATPVTGALTLSSSVGQILYRNDTPLPDPVGLDTKVAFTLKVVEDATTGTGDSGIRFGFSAMGITAAIAFVTTPLGDREVRLLDLLANEVLGSIPFDYLDGDYHTYRLLKNVGQGTVDFSIDL